MNYICFMHAFKSFLIVIYLLSAIGVEIRLHYCCGQLSDVHWYPKKQAPEECDNDHCCKAHKNCCSYQDICIKNCDDHHTPPLMSRLGYHQWEEHNNTTPASIRPVSQKKIKTNSKEPPPQHKKKSYIVFCQIKSCDHMI